MVNLLGVDEPLIVFEKKAVQRAQRNHLFLDLHAELLLHVGDLEVAHWVVLIEIHLRRQPKKLRLMVKYFLGAAQLRHEPALVHLSVDVLDELRNF